MGRIRRFGLKSQFDKYNTASGPSSQRWCVHLCTYNLWKVSVAFAPCWLILWRQEFMLWWGWGGRQMKRTLQPRWWPALHKSVGHFMSHTPHNPRNAQALSLRPQVARADANDAVPKQLATCTWQDLITNINETNVFSSFSCLKTRARNCVRTYERCVDYKFRVELQTKRESIEGTSTKNLSIKDGREKDVWYKRHGTERHRRSHTRATAKTKRIQGKEVCFKGKEIKERVLVTLFVCTSCRSLQDLLTKDIWENIQKSRVC